MDRLIDRMTVLTSIVSALIGALGSGLLFVSYRLAQYEASKGDVEKIHDNAVRAEERANDFKTQDEKLKHAAERIQQSREEAQRNLEVIRPFAEKSTTEIASKLAGDEAFRRIAADRVAASVSQRIDELKVRFHVEDTNQGFTASGKNPPGDMGHYLRPEITLNLNKDTRVLVW